MGRGGAARLGDAAGLIPHGTGCGQRPMQDGILTVRALPAQLRRSLEGRFPFVWVRGEVSNLSRPGSGHIYFSLKDQDAQLQCVWFRGQQRQAEQGQAFDPLTGEVFDTPRPSPLELLRNGLDLLCAGRISVYAPRGQYQLLVELVQPTGQGLLAQAFEERKRKLAEAGYFAQERKRPLPWNPQRVALITSPSGAAIHDFLELAQNRGCGAEIRLFPASVQGEEAAPEIIRALDEINAQGWAQVIVLIRGGGSLESSALNEAAAEASLSCCRPLAGTPWQRWPTYRDCLPTCARPRPPMRRNCSGLCARNSGNAWTRRLPLCGGPLPAALNTRNCCCGSGKTPCAGFHPRAIRPACPSR